MINAENGKINIKGNIADVSAECVLVLREIYKRNREKFSEEVALGILMNMMIRAIENPGGQDTKWEKSEEEIMAYTE